MEDNAVPNSLDDFPDLLRRRANSYLEAGHHDIAKFYADLAAKTELEGVPHRYDLLEWIIEYDWP